MGGKHPTGMHSWLQGVCVVAGACMVVRGHVSLRGGGRAWLWGGMRGCGGAEIYYRYSDQEVYLTIEFRCELVTDPFALKSNMKQYLWKYR